MQLYGLTFGTSSTTLIILVFAIGIELRRWGVSGPFFVVSDFIPIAEKYFSLTHDVEAQKAFVASQMKLKAERNEVNPE